MHSNILIYNLHVTILVKSIPQFGYKFALRYSSKTQLVFVLFKSRYPLRL